MIIKDLKQMLYDEQRQRSIAEKRYKDLQVELLAPSPDPTTTSAFSTIVQTYRAEIEAVQETSKKRINSMEQKYENEMRAHMDLKDQYSLLKSENNFLKQNSENQTTPIQQQHLQEISEINSRHAAEINELKKNLKTENERRVDSESLKLALEAQVAEFYSKLQALENEKNHPTPTQKLEEQISSLKKTRRGIR